MWSQNGTHLSVGDEYGKISVFQVGEVNYIQHILLNVYLSAFSIYLLVQNPHT